MGGSFPTTIHNQRVAIATASIPTPAQADFTHIRICDSSIPSSPTNYPTTVHNNVPYATKNKHVYFQQSVTAGKNNRRAEKFYTTETNSNFVNTDYDLSDFAHD